MIRIREVMVVGIVGVAFGLCAVVSAQNSVHSLSAQGGELANPRTSAEDIAAGAKMFRAHCATCHGRNAEGFRGPNLTTGRFRYGGSDTRLFRNILEGIPGTSMAGVYLPDTQIWQVISYVRSLSGTGEEIPVAGDPVQGQFVFATKGECATCHMVEGDGGRRGTNLSSIGWQRSVAHLRAAILFPGDSVDVKYRFVQVALASGDPIEGILLNEDTYSIQLMDEHENLVSVSKTDVTEIVRPDMSLMPDYLDVFTDQELTDLIAYLHSLGGVPTDE